MRKVWRGVEERGWGKGSGGKILGKGTGAHLKMTGVRVVAKASFLVS